MTAKLAKCRDCTRAYVAPRASAYFSCEAQKVLVPRDRERKSCAWFVARVAQNQWRQQRASVITSTTNYDAWPST